MGTLIDFQSAYQRRQDQRTERAGFTDLDRALASLESLLHGPSLQANFGVIRGELEAIHRSIQRGDIDPATEQIRRLNSRLAHASARRSS